MRKILKSVIIKGCISIFSLVVFLGLLEIGLRVYGRFYLLARERSLSIKETNISPIRQNSSLGKEKAEDYIILCLGDSYTFGGETTVEETYPAQLGKLLVSKKLGRKFKIINGGVCEYNSRQVLIRLLQYIKDYRPDLIILLVGSSNRFNFAGFSLQEAGIKGVINNLRVSKMIKIIGLNFKKKILLWRSKNKAESSLVFSSFVKETGSKFDVDGYPLPLVRKDAIARHYLEEIWGIRSISECHKPAEKIWFYFNSGNIKKALEFENIEVASADAIETSCALASVYQKIGNTQKAMDIFDKVYLRLPQPDFISGQLADFYSDLANAYIRQNKFPAAIEVIFKAIRADSICSIYYYILARAYTLQSRYNAGDIFGELKEMRENDPGLKGNKLFMNYLLFFQNRDKSEREIDKWLKQDLERIFELCQERNIKLVIQNYPYPYSIANNALRDVAISHDLPFVDNCKVFNELTAKNNYQKYFYNDDHCTAEGHRVMVENIYNTLVREKIIPE